MMMTFFKKLVGQQSDSMYICLKRYVFSLHGDIWSVHHSMWIYLMHFHFFYLFNKWTCVIILCMFSLEIFSTNYVSLHTYEHNPHHTYYAIV